MNKLPLDVLSVVCEFLTLDEVLVHFKDKLLELKLDWAHRADTDDVADLVDFFNVEGADQKLALKVLRGEIMQRRLHREFYADVDSVILIEACFGSGAPWTAEIHAATNSYSLFGYGTCTAPGFVTRLRGATHIQVCSRDLPMTQKEFAKRVVEKRLDERYDRLCSAYTYTRAGSRHGDLFLFEYPTHRVDVATRRDVLIEIGMSKWWWDTREIDTCTAAEFLERVNSAAFKQDVPRSNKQYEIRMPTHTKTVSCVFWRMNEVSSQAYGRILPKDWIVVSPPTA